MDKSESIQALAKALAISQGELENASKNAANPHYKSKYADLAEVLNTVRPVFAKHGLSFVQFPSFEGGIAHVETMLMHESGEWIRNTASAPVSKQDAQGVGSAVTYLRRYSVAAMSGIAQEDDDGNSAVGAHGKAPVIPSNLTIGDSEFKELNRMLDETKSDKVAFCSTFGIQSVAALPMAEYAKAIAMLNHKIKQKENKNG